MSTTFQVTPVVIPPLSCPKVILPTKADLVNVFSQLANLPSQLILAGQEESAKQIQDILDSVRELLSIYDPKFQTIEIPEMEWEIMITRLIQDYPMYVQQKLLELISKLTPISFELNILGIDIDILKIFTQEEIAKVKLQLSKELDKFYGLLPESYKFWDGEFGFECPELKAEAIWSYIRSKINGGMTGLLADAFKALIKLFETIWDSLGLPDIPLPLVDLNVESILQAIIKAWKKKVEQGKATYADLIEELEGISLAGFNLLDLLGGKITESVVSAERQIERLLEGARDFSVNWPRYLLTKWMETVTKFFEAIGLGALIEFITFTFCDFLELLGFPKTIDLSFSDDISIGTSNTSVLPT
ncbi:hypothetical protein N9159_00205 [bacterium]|nr:hypothetical protein [bacterium]